MTNGHEAWVKLIDERLGRKKKYTAQQRVLFAHVLLRVVPEAVEYKQIAAPKNDDVKQARKELQKINDLLSSFRERVETAPFLNLVEFSVSTVFQEQWEIKDIERYLLVFAEHLEDTYATTQTQRGGDLTALAVCQFVCRAYERCLGENPHVYDYDRIGQSGDVSDGTPYERVCSAVEDRFKIPLPWTTRKKATETYHRGLVDFDRAFPDDEVKWSKQT